MSINTTELNNLILSEESSGRKIIFLDASALKDSGCWRKFYWSAIKGYRPKTEYQSYNLKIEYGSAFHKFLELWYRNSTLSEATKAAGEYYDKILSHPSGSAQLLNEHEFRTMTHLLQSIKAYAEVYPRETDGLKAVATERKFAFPYWRNEHFSIFLSGTIDLEGTYHNIPCIVDHKTSAPWDQSENGLRRFFEPYDMDIQTMFYVWVWKHLHPEDSRYRPIVVNGIFSKRVTIKASKEGRFDGIKFQRSGLLEYGEEQMKAFEAWFFYKLHTLKYHIENTLQNMELFYDLTCCRGPFGLCEFFGVCKQPTSVQTQILKSAFVETKYQPLAFGGTGE